MQIGLLNNEEDAEIKKPSATNPPFKGRRKYKRVKKILSTQRLVEFLSEH